MKYNQFNNIALPVAIVGLVFLGGVNISQKSENRKNETSASEKQVLIDLQKTVLSLESKIDKLNAANKINTGLSSGNINSDESGDLQELIQASVKMALEKEIEQQKNEPEANQHLKQQEDEQRLETVISMLETSPDTVTRKGLNDDITALSPEGRQQVFEKVSQMLNNGEIDPEQYFKGYAVR